MNVYDTGFTAEEIADPQDYTCYLAIWSKPRGKKSPFAGDLRGLPGAYYLLIGGGGAIIRAWGAGRSTYDDALRAFGVQRALSLVPSAAKLQVHCPGLIDNIRPRDGHVRWAMEHNGLKRGKGIVPFDAFEPMADIATAYPERWTLIPVPRRSEPYAYVQASQQVQGQPMRTANAYDALQTVSEANVIFATDEDPDPALLLGLR